MINITILIVNYKSSEKTLKFINKIPKNYQIIVVDNSNNGDLKKKIQNLKNVEIIETKNDGYGSAINKGSVKVLTKYFFAFSPDIQGVDSIFLEKFEKIIKSGLKFGAIGPRFLNVSEKSHNQSNINKKIGKINAISGAAILLNMNVFNQVGGFDEKIFLFFEENDLCTRIIKKNFNIYQLNYAKIFHPKGIDKGVVEAKRENEIELKNFYGWHYMWSKFYHFKKNKLNLLAYIYFFPILLRLSIRIILYIVISDIKKKSKYQMRLSGLITSMLNKESDKRIGL